MWMKTVCLQFDTQQSAHVLTGGPRYMLHNQLKKTLEECFFKMFNSYSHQTISRNLQHLILENAIHK